MIEVHAHEVLHMMEGRNFTEESLKKAIIETFGEDARFFSCCQSGMNASQIVEFLKSRGKFMPMQEGFTVDPNQVCEHDHHHEEGHKCCHHE